MIYEDAPVRRAIISYCTPRPLSRMAVSVAFLRRGPDEREVLTSMDQAGRPRSEPTDSGSSIIESGGEALLLHSSQTPGASPRVSLPRSSDTPLNLPEMLWRRSSPVGHQCYLYNFISCFNTFLPPCSQGNNCRWGFVQRSFPVAFVQRWDKEMKQLPPVSLY